MKTKTLEEKKRERKQRYITNDELEKHLNSKEMKDLLKQLEKIEKCREKLKNVSVGEY
jgi:hypothetical protein